MTYLWLYLSGATGISAIVINAVKRFHDYRNRPRIVIKINNKRNKGEI